MKIIKQLAWILSFTFIGEICSKLLASIILIPGPVIGMILLFIALVAGIVKVEQIEEVGEWLANNMTIFFIPAGVALIDHLGLLLPIWWKLLLILVVSTVVMMAIVSKAMDLIINRQESKKERGGAND